MGSMSIGEVAQKVGVRTSAIRYYERIGLLPAARRISGRRYYDADVLPKLGVIQMAQRAGFTITEIQTLLHDFPVDTPPSVRWQTLAARKLVEINARIEEAHAMKDLLERALQCQCLDLDACVQMTPDAASDRLNINVCCEVSNSD